MATAEQLKRQKDALTRAIKPATTQKQAEANMYRASLLEKLNNPTVTTTKTGDKPTLGGLEGRPDTKTTNKSIDQTTTATTPYYYGQSGSSLGGKTVKDPTTGKVYRADSSKGQALVEQYGFTDAPVEPTAPATYAEIGEANLAAEANTLNQFGYDLGLEADQFLTPLEEAKRQIQIQREAKLAQEAQIDEQQQQLEYDTGAAKRSAESALDTTVAQLTGSREGVTSLSNVSASDKLKEATGLQISRLLASQDASNAALDQARVQLAEAERSGNQAIIQNARNALLAAEQDAMATETAYRAVLTEQSAEERARQAQQAQNVESFATLVQQGTEMDYNTIASLASQYGLPTDMLMGYYQGAQAIRDDKTLDLATKETQLAQLNQDLSDQINGINTAQAQNVEYLKKLYQSGADPDVIAAFKSAAGITDYNDPFTIAELNYKNAQIAYQESATATNYQALLTAQAEYDDLYGGEAYLPNGAYDFQTFTAEDGSQGIRVAVTDGQSLDIPGTDRREDWCAAFVNDALGTAFGDTFEQKASMINSDIPAPGMAFVMATAEKWGHVGIVESVNFANGTMTVVESNWQKGDDDKGIISRRTMFISDAEGFVKAPKSTSTNDNGLLTQQANALIFDLGGTSDERSVISSQMVQMVESGQAKDLADAKSQLGLITKSDRELQDAMTAEIKPLREDFTTAKSKLASLPALLASGEAIGDVASIVNFLKVIDPNSVARETEVQSVENATSLLGQFEQAIQKAQTGEKLTSEQRQQLSSTADIIASSFADTYLQELYRRQDELAKKGIPMTFASTSEISSLESFLGTDRVNQIKEGLGLDFEPTEDDYINTVIQDAENSDIYDYIDSASSSNSNRAFSMGIGSASPFKQ